MAVAVVVDMLASVKPGAGTKRQLRVQPGCLLVMQEHWV